MVLQSGRKLKIYQKQADFFSVASGDFTRGAKRVVEIYCWVWTNCLEVYKYHCFLGEYLTHVWGKKEKMISVWKAYTSSNAIADGWFFSKERTPFWNGTTSLMHPDFSYHLRKNAQKSPDNTINALNYINHIRLTAVLPSTLLRQN